MTETLEPWVIDDIARIWNEHSKPLHFRTFSVGKSGSKPKAAMRLTRILVENAEWLGGSSHTDPQLLYERFREKLVACLAHIHEEGLDEVNKHLDRPLSIALGFWQFTRPDLQNVHVISAYRWGSDPVAILQADKERRISKAEVLSEWKADLNEHLRRLAYLSTSEDDGTARLKKALDKARMAMAIAEEEISD